MKNYKIFTIISLVLMAFSAQASVEVLGSLKHLYKAKPGDIIKGEIRIQNNDPTDQEVRIYQTDLLYNLEESTFYDEPEAHARSNAKWIQYSPKTLVLKSKETRLIQYEIVVPKNAALNGTYWSIMMVEGVMPIDPNQQGDLSIRTLTRYAIQMVTEMEDAGNGSLKFLEPSLISDENKNLFLAVDLQNNGDRYISPEISIEFFDSKGESVATLTAPRKGLYPFTSTRFKIDLKGLPSKKTYKAMIIAAGKDDDVFGLEYTLYF
jgi:hypothetical protein